MTPTDHTALKGLAEGEEEQMVSRSKPCGDAGPNSPRSHDAPFSDGWKPIETAPCGEQIIVGSHTWTGWTIAKFDDGEHKARQLRRWIDGPTVWMRGPDYRTIPAGSDFSGRQGHLPNTGQLRDDQSSSNPLLGELERMREALREIAEHPGPNADEAAWVRVEWARRALLSPEQNDGADHAG